MSKPQWSIRRIFKVAALEPGECDSCVQVSLNFVYDDDGIHEHIESDESIEVTEVSAENLHVGNYVEVTISPIEFQEPELSPLTPDEELAYKKLGEAARVVQEIDKRRRKKP